MPGSRVSCRVNSLSKTRGPHGAPGVQYKCGISRCFFHSGMVYLPLWKIWKSVGMIIPNIWKNKKCSKPPTNKLSINVQFSIAMLVTGGYCFSTSPVLPQVSVVIFKHPYPQGPQEPTTSWRHQLTSQCCLARRSTPTSGGWTPQN